MPGIIDLSNIFHHIRVKLYPNYLPKADKGTYIARTDSDKSVNIRDICTIMVARTGFDGNFETLYDYVSQFFDEVAYQICDGFNANLGYFTVHPNVGGVFQTQNEAHDRKKHPISFRFSALAKLRDLVKNIDVQVEGIAETPAYIDEFIDLENEYINSQYEPESMFVIHGHKIKVAGAIDAGVYFVPIDAPQDAVEVERIGENTPTRITGIAPATGYPKNRIEIHTWYSGSDKTHLKASRVITSPFVLEEV
jgi:hypothetical protein